MKTKEELNALKKEVETLNKKLSELTEEELEQINACMVVCRNGDCANCSKTNCSARKI